MCASVTEGIKWKSVGYARVPVLTHQNRSISGFVAERADYIVIVEAVKTQSGGFHVGSRGLQQEVNYRCGSAKLATLFLLNTYNALKEEGWSLTLLREL